MCFQDFTDEENRIDMFNQCRTMRFAMYNDLEGERTPFKKRCVCVCLSVCVFVCVCVGVCECESEAETECGCE